MVAPKKDEPTLPIIDEYCQNYRNLFSDVRSYQEFKDIHIGMLSGIPRKTLPKIAEVTGLKNSQGLHNFLTEASWDVQELRNRRIAWILRTLKGRKIKVIIDETGDDKKGEATDYVARQYIGKLGKIENGIVAVVAFGVIDNITFPLLFEVYKPKNRLKEGDIYQSKPQIAAKLVEEIVNLGFEIELVLADSLYGEAEENFLRKLEELKLEFLVSIPSNHGEWMLPGQRVRANKWRKFERKFSDGKTEIRYIREIIYGKRRRRTYWEVTTDPETLPENSTRFLMTNQQTVTYLEIGNEYGERTWVEYGFRQSKSELGWADFRLTKYADIEKWWELVCSAYWLITLQTTPFQDGELKVEKESQKILKKSCETNRYWNHQKNWKSVLNNFQLLLKPWMSFKLIDSWLEVFPIPELSLGFSQLIQLINWASHAFFPLFSESDFLFSSA